MLQNTNWAGPDGHIIGRVMKETVKRVLETIRNLRHGFEITKKEGYSGQMDDMFTTADVAAQEIYVRALQECYPDFGLIAEENGLRRNKDATIFFSVDPLDGTKAFVRKQSHGVGTMSSISTDGEFLGAWIGDINTQELYYTRPGSNKVHRLSEFRVGTELKISEHIPLSSQYSLLRDPTIAYHATSRQFVGEHCKNYEISGGSIGIWMARLWKGEVGSVLIPPGTETPWDSNPINTITTRLGFVFLRPRDDFQGWERYTVSPIRKVQRREHDTLIVHKSNLHELDVRA